MINLTKKQKDIHEQKHKTRGSIRVFKSEIFYNLNAQVKRMKIFDGINTTLLVPSACTKGLVIILNKFGISPELVMKDSKKLKIAGEIKGLEFDSIKSIKGDHDHLRINYSSFEGEPDLSTIILHQIKWLESKKIAYGESDGTQACIRGKCFTSEELKSKQKTLDKYSEVGL